MAEYRQIPALVLEKLRNDTHFEAVTDVRDVIREDTTLQAYFTEAIQAFNAAVQDEKAALAESAKSAYTEAIAKKDTERDSTLDTVKTLIRNVALTGTTNQKVSAEHLASMAKIMKVKTSLQYDQETGQISMAVDELLGKYEPYTEAAGIKPFVLTLKRLNDEMCELLILRDTERGEQGKSRVAAMRTETDKAYRELVRQVNALEIAFAIGKLAGQPEFDPFANFISFMIGQIDRYKREILRSSGEEVVEDETIESETVEGDGGTTTESEEEETLTRKDDKKD